MSGREQALLQSVEDMVRLIAELLDLRRRVRRAEAIAPPGGMSPQERRRRCCRFYPVGGGGAIQPSGRRAVNSDQSEVLPKADIGSGGGHIGFVPQGDLVTPSDTRTTAPPSRPHPQPRLIGPEWSKTWTTTNEERP